jgi:hypothetical protein
MHIGVTVSNGHSSCTAVESVKCRYILLNYLRTLKLHIEFSYLEVGSWGCEVEMMPYKLH